MGFYGDQLLPRITDRALGVEAYQKWRQRTVEGLAGTVLELGFGSGLNLAHLPPGVTTLLAVEPSATARRLAQPRIEEAGCDVRHVGLDGQTLAVESESVDAVLTTWTLCTIPQVGRALREAARVLRPGGRLHFLEHGLSPRPRVARTQHWLTPLHRRFAGGCHLDRDIPELLRGAGFHIDALERFELPRTPALFGAMVQGRARVAFY